MNLITAILFLEKLCVELPDLPSNTTIGESVNLPVPHNTMLTILCFTGYEISLLVTEQLLTCLDQNLWQPDQLQLCHSQYFHCLFTNF